jgi:hypothetical protein
MRKTTLIVICLFIGLSASMAMGQEYLDFTFDYLAFASATAGRWDSDTDGPLVGVAHASAYYAKYHVTSSSSASAGINTTGIWTETGMIMDPGDAFDWPEATATVDGTFSIQTAGDAALSALVTPTYTSIDHSERVWQVEVWDEADPGTILFELNAGNLSADVVLAGGTDYGVNVYQWGETMSTLEYSLDVQFTAVAVAGPDPDFNGDGTTDADDIDMLCANFGDGAYDLDGDGDCDQDDLVFLVETLVEWDNGVASGVGTFLGDSNLDGEVNGTDLSIMSAGFGSAPGFAGGDANGDGLVDGTDLSILSSTFGNITTAAVPEPLTIGLLGLGGMSMLRRRC